MIEYHHRAKSDTNVDDHLGSITSATSNLCRMVMHDWSVRLRVIFPQVPYQSRRILLAAKLNEFQYLWKDKHKEVFCNRLDPKIR
jgi:hypothetical protein